MNVDRSTRKKSTVRPAAVELPAQLPAYTVEDQFRLFVDSVSEYAIFLLDRIGNVVTWNRGAERIKGYTAADIIGRHFSIFYTPEDVQRGHPMDELAIAADVGRYEEEGWRVRKDGTRFWANVVITAIKDNEGNLQGFGKVTRDFTERRLAEDRLRRSEERFRLLVQGVRDYAIFMLDLDGNVASWNEGAERIKGYRADEVMGQHFSRFYTPEDVADGKPARELRTAAQEGRYEEEGWRVRKDGTQFWANVVITPMVDDEGKLYGYAKVTRDFTERKRAENARAENMHVQISRSFLREILYSVTEGKLRFCESETELPQRLRTCPVQERPFDNRGIAQLRADVRAMAATLGLTQHRLDNIVTAASEAGMNAVVHAHHATYSVCGTAGIIQVWVTDTGSGIALQQLHRATLERGFTTDGSLGHGFWLILHTCDRVWLHSTSEGTTVVLEQEVMAPDPEWLSRPRDLVYVP